MTKAIKTLQTLTALLILGVLTAPLGHAQSNEPSADMEDMPYVQLRSLDKITARSLTFEAKVGSTVKFGEVFVKVQACRKSPPIEKPEAAAFLQIWEADSKASSEWVFSGWMFASSPGLSHMDHPVYDVWVLDCLAEKTPDEVLEKEENADQALEGEGEVSPSEAAPAPETEPEIEVEKLDD